MRWSTNHLFRDIARCTRSALGPRTITDAIFLAILLSAAVAALGPTIFIQSPSNTTYASTAISLNYTVGNASTCKYELTNTSGSFNTSLPLCGNATLAGITEGQNSVRVLANDSANNWNASNTVYFSLDTTPPAWTEVPANQTVGYNTSFAYDVNATDLSGVGSYWISDSANFTINSSSGLIANNTLLAVGAYPLNVSVNDTLGNTNSALFTVNVRFDVTPPAINLISPQFANYTTATPNLSVTTSENSRIIYNWDRIGNISGCLNCTSYNSTYGEFAPDSDTLLLLHFNENYGNRTYDQTGANNGTLQGANWAAGRFGYGLKFDGIDDNATFSTSLNPTVAFTVEAWADATGASASMAIVDKYEPAGINGYGYSLLLEGGNATFVASRYPNWGPIQVSITSDIRNTGWHYLAGVYDGNTIRVFLDNQSATYGLSGYTGGVAPSSVNLTIGNRQGSSFYFNGTIDEVRITNRNLSDPELAANRDRRLADGAHNMTVYATDGAGNTNASFITFNTDATLPFCTFLSANRTYFNNGTPLNFTAFCNDTFSGVSLVYLNASAIGGGIVQMSPIGGGNYTYSLTANNNRSESVNVSIYNVMDAYGNANFSNPILMLTVDNTNPSVSFNLSLNQSWQKGTITVNYNATDTQTIGACIWRWQNSTAVWSNYSAVACGSALTFQFDTTNCPDSSTAVCRVELFANDSAGNFNYSELYFRIDNNPPNISGILPLNNSVVYSNTTRISFNITDIASGVNLSTLTINDTQSLYNTTNISCSLLANGYNCSLSLAQTDGFKQLTISAYDNLSNLAQSTVYYTVGGCQSPASGNWVINYTQSCANKTIILNGNLTVQSNGNLTFRNATLLLNGTYNGSRKIEVQGGAFYIRDNDGVQSTSDGSNITALNTSNRFLFMVGANSTFEMRNSELSYVGYAAATLNETGVYLDASNIHITGTALSHSFNALVGVATSGTFENNTIHSNSGAGIQLVSNGSVFLSNKIFGNDMEGIFLINSSNSILSYNNISSNNRAVRLSGSSNNTLLNNTLSGNNAEGVYLSASRNNSLLNNTLNSNSGGGIYMERGSDTNLIQYNNITSNNYGLRTYNSTGNSMLSNSFAGNSQYGIGMVSTDFNMVSNNTLTTNYDGLYLQYSNSNNFSGNTISGSVRYALYVDNSQNNSFSQDTFGGYFGLYLSGSHNNTFAQSTVSSVLEGIELAASSNNTITSASITSGSGPDLSSKVNSTNTLLNSSYSRSKTYFENGNSKIFRQWYLRVTTVNTTGSPVNNSNITILDNLSATVFAGLTGADGSALIPLTESTVSTTTTNYTPHRIVANTSGYFGNASANMNQSREVTVVVYDITPPQLLAYWFEPQYIYPNGTTTFRAHIWENAGISRAFFSLATPNGTYNYSLAYESQNSTGQNWVAQITNTSRLGQYNVSYFFINDTNRNNNTLQPSAYFRVQSDLPPNITLSETNPPSVEANSSITISANITDDYNVSAAYLSVFQPVNATASMNFVSGNRTAGLWQASYTPAATGAYYYRIVANDNSSNTAYSSQYSFNSTPYNCTSASRINNYPNCISAGCLWTQEDYGICSFYTATGETNSFNLTVTSGNLSLFLANKDTTGRLSSDANRNTSLTVSINANAITVPIALYANTPREFAVLTNGLLVSPENSTILSTAYSDYKLSSVINGSGNRSAFAYTSTFGQPSGITLDNNTLSFTYNSTTKIADFTINLGSPHTLDIRFTQPCAPSGGQCGTCCSGLVCCSGICTSSCSSQQQPPQLPGATQGSSIKSVSISTSATRIETKIGVPSRFTVTVKNTGTENLTAVTLDVTNVTRGWFSIVPSAQNFPVGYEATYTVTVNPPLDGTYNFSIYVPTPRSEYIPMTLIVKNEFAQLDPQEQAGGTTKTPEETKNDIQELEQLASQIAENITNAKNQGADTSAIEKTLEEARLALAEGKPDKARLLMDYIQGEIPKLKTNQAAAAGGAPTLFIALIALSILGFIAARYKGYLFPQKAEGAGETVTFSRETESAPRDTRTRISDLRSRIVQADNAIESGNIQKAEELYSAIQKEYDDLVLNSVGADARTVSALNEVYASIARIYEQLNKKG